MTRRRPRPGATSSGISQRVDSHHCQRISEDPLEAVALTGRSNSQEEEASEEEQEEVVVMLGDPDLASNAERPLT